MLRVGVACGCCLWMLVPGVTLSTDVSLARRLRSILTLLLCRDLVDVQARVVGASKGRLKSNLCSSFRKSKEDGWAMHKQMFTMEQYEFLQEYFLGGNYYA